MAVAVTISNFVQSDDRYYIRFSDGTELEFASIEDINLWAREVESPDTAQRLFVAWWAARSPELSNVNLVKNKTMTLDLSASAPIKVQ